MPLSVDAHQTPDLIEGREPKARTRWRVPLLLVGGGVTVLLAGALASMAAQDDGGAEVVDASGSMAVEHDFDEAADRPGSLLSEGKQASFSGPIKVELPDRQLVGTARLIVSYAAQIEGDDEARLFHNWGEVHATFGTTTCNGPFAVSFYREPHETGGAMSLRCDDGSLLAATAGVEGDEGATLDHPYRMFITLTDGSYVAG